MKKSTVYSKDQLTKFVNEQIEQELQEIANGQSDPLASWWDEMPDMFRLNILNKAGYNSSMEGHSSRLETHDWAYVSEEMEKFGKLDALIKQIEKTRFAPAGVIAASNNRQNNKRGIEQIRSLLTGGLSSLDVIKTGSLQDAREAANVMKVRIGTVSELS